VKGRGSSCARLWRLWPRALLGLGLVLPLLPSIFIIFVGIIDNFEEILYIYMKIFSLMLMAHGNCIIYAIYIKIILFLSKDKY
jgi:hypothetical protein